MFFIHASIFIIIFFVQIIKPLDRDPPNGQEHWYVTVTASQGDVVNEVHHPVGTHHTFIPSFIDIQLNLGITDVKGPTNFICYWRIFVVANIGIEMI